MLTTDSQSVKDPAPKDFGHRLGVEHWQNTVHVFSSQGMKNPYCGLCLERDYDGRHCPAEPYGPRPTFTRIESAKDRDGFPVGWLSCGHGPIGLGGMRPDKRPDVGTTYECWDCQRPVDDRNRPGLPDAIRAEIEAALPKCPDCGGPIDKIPFIKRTVHKYQANVDWQTGEILAGSEDHDELEETPDWYETGPRFGQHGGVLGVECANGHSWATRRLSYQYKDGEHIWTVLPASETAPDPTPATPVDARPYSAGDADWDRAAEAKS